MEKIILDGNKLLKDLKAEIEEDKPKISDYKLGYINALRDVRDSIEDGLYSIV